MGFLGRFLERTRLLTRVVLAPAEDPRETSAAGVYQRQSDLLKLVALARAQVGGAKRELEASTGRIAAEVETFETEARSALASGREDVARQILQRRQVTETELHVLRHRLAEIEEEERSLSLAEQQLAVRLESFRAQQEVVQARSVTQARIGRALGQVSRDAGALELTFERARASSEMALAEVSAVDRLSGLLEATSSSPDTAIDQIQARDSIERQLATMKRELSAHDAGAAATG